MRLHKYFVTLFFIFLLINPFNVINLYAHEIHNDKNKSTSFSADDEEEYCTKTHSLGKLVLSVGAISFGGLGFIGYGGYKDCFTSDQLPYKASEYPKGSAVAMNSGISTWYGGIVDGDTLVTQGNYGEFWGQYDYIMRSSIETASSYSKNSIAELDFILKTDDTTTIVRSFLNYRSYDKRPHKPLGIKTTNSSFSWSYEYSEDFVLFELEIKNISTKTINDFYFAFNTYEGTGYSSLLDIDGKDDIIGFLPDYTLESNCAVTDKLNMMWMADNDGDPYEGEFLRKLTVVGNEHFRSSTDVTGVFNLKDFSSLRTGVKTAYNWWAAASEDQTWFMPIARSSKIQRFERSTGHPFGDDYRYIIMSNNEIDYDQIHTASIGQEDPVWHYPNQKYALNISDGFSGGGSLGSNHTHHILSIGPFNIPPGAVLKIPYAYVAGENFHTIPSNGDNLPDNPKLYYSNLDFSDIAKNAQWARWIYDNPGVDTDGDGDSGRYTVCVLDSQFIDNEWMIVAADTFWYKGDDVPDWKAAGPPPAPYFWINPTLNGVHVRFNGSRSETEKDIFTRIADFEGYNIYFGRDERESSLSLVASYDKNNYDKFIYHENISTYIIEDIPMTLEEIRCAYADSCNDPTYDPLFTSRTNPIFVNDSIIFFKKHSYNVETSAIKKVYPNARDPRTIHIDSFVDTDYTEEGYFKYFEYEYRIENLLPTVDYWVNVTAFDFGAPKSGLKALETSKTINIQNAYPLMHADDLSDERKQVYVYPNPYRIDARYRQAGYEGRTEEDRPDYRVRELNFANLPPKCEIKIFSLDGDLIRHLAHDIPSSDPTFSHAQWNLITRNTQMIVSGLYYWTVEFPDGDVQVGKFVVIM